MDFVSEMRISPRENPLRGDFGLKSFFVNRASLLCLSLLFEKFIFQHSLD